MLNEKSARNPLDNKFYEDIYVSKKDNDNWMEAIRFDQAVNGKKNSQNNAAIELSADEDEVYIYIGNAREGDVYVAKLNKKKEWIEPKSLRGQVNSDYYEGSICLTADERTMYFIGSDPKTTLGGTDIYVIEKDEKGKWKRPINLGTTINTNYNEAFVRLSTDEKTLYFCSKGHNTMGGYDIFKSELGKNGLWSEPVNLGYPVNTPDDDVFYTEVPGKKYAYYSTIRENSVGGMDIYKVIYLGAEKEMMFSGEDDLIAGYPIEENIYFYEPELLNIELSIVMTGTVTDKLTALPVVGRIEVIDKEESQIVATSISDTTGVYKMKIPQAKKYGIQILAKGYLLYLTEVDLSAETYEKEAVRDFQLDRIEVGAKVILRNIFFDFNKATLKPESYVELENVVKLLQNNENLRIEISGHTDNVGSAKYNQKLSESRAAAVVDYLIIRGISGSRLEFKGYGLEQPITSNTTDEGRAQNRRVEFKILSK
jgi:outer membrane protein OmpA-like peptidoglycan-associated protein